MRKFLKAAILDSARRSSFWSSRVANRQIVMFSLDPFGSPDPADPLVFAMPLFALAIVLVIIGVLIGGIATWLRQGKWRRLARQREERVARRAGRKRPA